MVHRRRIARWGNEQRQMAGHAEADIGRVAQGSMVDRLAASRPIDRIPQRAGGGITPSVGNRRLQQLSVAFQTV
jgi:hypothetical protein